jgi:hypothetical protein
MYDNCRYVTIWKNLPESLATTGLCRIISVYLMVDKDAALFIQTGGIK